MLEGELAGLYLAKDVAMWCKTLEEFKIKLDSKIKLTREIIKDGENI